jgi:hypothetical protein
LIAAISAVVYRSTLCPTVEFIDSGELALACKNLGIAHPTGYPLYTILGRLSSMILWGTLIHKMNLVSLACASLATGFLFLSVSQFLSIIGPGIRWKTPAAVSASLFASFAPVWWAQGTTNEVYSLNLLLLSISLWAMFKYINVKDRKWIMISCYGLGLCLTNHLSSVYIIPAYIYLIIYLRKKRLLDVKTIIYSLALFIFPLTIYLFLPLRARFSPFLNWGGVDDLYFLYKHISGWQYRIWMFSSFSLGGLLDKIGISASLLYRQISWIGLLFCAAGLTWSLARRTYLSLFIILIVILNFIYASNYEIIDIESYYLPMIIALSLVMGAGMAYSASLLIELFKNGRIPRYIIPAGLILFPVFRLIDNFYLSDRSMRTFARQGAIDLIDSMEPGGLAFVENWDFYSPWLYLHFEENYRPDIVLLDKELMRSWYIGFLKGTSIFAGCQRRLRGVSA